MGHMNAEELANRWGMTVGRLANMRCAGRGPRFLRIGRHVVYRVEDVEEYERGCVVEPIR